MTNNDENAKNPKWQIPMEQSGVKPEDYSSEIDSGNGSANTSSQSPANNSNQSGVEGFAPNLGGHGKANHSNTSSFGKDLPTNSPEGKVSEFGQEEGGRMRQPTTSIIGRVGQDKTNN